MQRLYLIVQTDYSEVFLKFYWIAFSFLLFIFYISISQAQNISVPKGCLLNCEEQFRFIASVTPNATRNDFIKVFGREHRRTPYDSGESIHVFKSAFGLVISVFFRSRLEAVSIWSANNKNRISPIPGSNQTLSEQKYSNLRHCGIQSRSQDLEIIEDRLRAFAISKACKTSAEGFSRQVYVFRTEKCPFSETEILRNCPNILKPTAVIVSTNRVKGRTYGALGVECRLLDSNLLRKYCKLLERIRYVMENNFYSIIFSFFQF